MAFLARLEGTRAGGDHAVEARPRPQSPLLQSSQHVAPSSPFHCLSLGRSPYCDPTRGDLLCRRARESRHPRLVESNRSLGLAALAASERLEVTDNLQLADTPHLASLMRAARVREGQTEGREGWAEDEKATADMLYKSIIVRGRRAKSAVAAAASREELERLNPDLLDKASGGPSAAGEPGPESEGEGAKEEEGGEASEGGSEEGT
jgi:hypothetical protein